MDYIDELNNQIQRQYEIADEMERLGFETEEEYYSYMADLEADAQEELIEARMLDDIGG